MFGKKMWLTILLSVLGLTVCISIWFDRTRDSWVESRADEECSFTVTDAATGKPITGATITVYNPYPNASDFDPKKTVLHSDGQGHALLRRKDCLCVRRFKGREWVRTSCALPSGYTTLEADGYEMAYLHLMQTENFIEHGWSEEKNCYCFSWSFTLRKAMPGPPAPGT